MVLNIFPRREPKAAPSEEAATPLPEPANDVIEAAEERKRTTRRGSRGGRGRTRSGGDLIAEQADELQPSPTDAPDPAPKPRRASRSRATAKAAEAGEQPAEPDQPAAETQEPSAAPPARRRGQKAEPAARAVPPTVSEDGSTAAIMRAIEAQGRQIEQLARLHEEIARRPNGSSPAAPPARVGIFVDSANVELASDRLRARFDWGKILHLLTRDRQLVRAIAYSPVHDDPGVSIETQRFVEPFLERGYKVVTKPLKRFADGSIKANVDIELALDVIEMLDRLDVVVLISGDGDFQRLVEVVQSKGVRVEVVAVGSSTASNLRHAADQYIDLQSRLKEIRA